MKKKLLALLLGLTLCLSLAACGSDAAETVTLTVAASPTPHAEILNQCVPILAEQGIELVVNEYSDYVVPNTAVEDGGRGLQLTPAPAYLESSTRPAGTIW